MNQLEPGCTSCKTLSGIICPPGGFVYENDHWTVFLGAGSLSVPQGYIVLRRHCEELKELTAEECSTLGMVIQNTTRVFATVISPARVHVGLYAEVVRHIHWHVIPRMSNMPAGHIPLTLLIAWNRLLQRVGLRRACSDEEVARLSLQMRLEFKRLESTVS